MDGQNGRREGGCRTGLYGTRLACANGAILSGGANGPMLARGVGWDGMEVVVGGFLKKGEARR